MKRAGALALIAALVVFAFVPPSYAAGGRHPRHHGFHHGGLHHRGFHHHGSHHGGFHHRGFHHRGRHHHGFHTGAFIGFGLAYPYYPYYYPPYGPRTVVIEQPPIYVQRAPTTAPLEPGYWYFCQSRGAYYPTAPSCPEAWVKVPPRTE